MRSAVFRLFLLLLALGLFACAAPEEKRGRDTYVLEGSAFGTYYVVKVVAPSSGALTEAQLQGLHRELESELTDVDAKISSYRPDSEVSRWNTGEEPLAFSQETFEVLLAALEIAGKTGGAFDPTVGPLVEAWGFGPQGRHGDDGTKSVVEEAMARVGFARLELDAAVRKVKRKVPGMRLDLSAIGEGHAIDRLSSFLAARGYDDVLVELGGEARARGRNALGEKWRIGIELPSLERGHVQRIVELDGEAIATSGDYRKYYEKDGERLSHLLDPRQGRPIRHKLASVSVIAPTCRSADAWATALMVLGPEEGFGKAEAENLPAFFLVREGERFVEKPTPAFVRGYQPQAKTSR